MMICKPLALIGLVLIATGASTAEIPASCPVSFANHTIFGNDVLDVILPGRGVVFRPGGGGFVLPDGALALKVAWNRKKPGQLTITGRRLDDSAPPLRAKVLNGYGDIGGQTTMIAFTTPGCWEVTGRIPDGSLTFVIFVERIGKGPEGRDDW